MKQFLRNINIFYSTAVLHISQSSDTRRCFTPDFHECHVQAKLDDLRVEADRLMDEHPDEAQQIRTKFEEMEKVWNELREMLKQREESLGEAGTLQKFVRDLDQFQVSCDLHPS